jgi:hypothetical protein
MSAEHKNGDAEIVCDPEPGPSNARRARKLYNHGN